MYRLIVPVPQYIEILRVTISVAAELFRNNYSSLYERNTSRLSTSRSPLNCLEMIIQVFKLTNGIHRISAHLVRKRMSSTVI